MLLESLIAISTIHMFLEALVRRLVIALGILLSVLGFGGAAVSAADDVAPVDVLQVDGLLDHVVASEIVTAVERSATNGAQALILQVNSKGSLL
ncbi:MAG: hypothetical protein VW962_06625, partial [Acidimicrobiaceae bacterium]